MLDLLKEIGKHSKTYRIPILLRLKDLWSTHTTQKITELGLIEKPKGGEDPISKTCDKFYVSIPHQAPSITLFHMRFFMKLQRKRTQQRHD